MPLVLNNLVPIFLVIALGSALRRSGAVDERFFVLADRLVYYIFFPALLFWKIGRPAPAWVADWTWILVLLAAMVIVSGASLVLSRVAGMPDRRRGVFCQSTYRFNTYLGLALILGLFGETGVRHFGAMISLAIPLANLMAVSILIWPHGRSLPPRRRLWFLTRELIANPLIIACVAGLVYSRLGWGWPTFVERTLSLTTSLSLPLALLSIGGGLRFAALRSNWRPALAASGLKLLGLPLIGFAGLWLVGASGTFVPVAMVWLTLPTSTLVSILSGQLDGDTELAAAVIVMSHLVSLAALSAVLLLFC